MADDTGIFRTDLEIENLARPGARQLLHGVLVDTGAEYSCVPASVLEALGVARQKRHRYQQADGSILERDVGFAILRAAGVPTADDVVFGEPRS